MHNAAKDKPPLECRGKHAAKRHMPPWVFVTYDTVLGMAIYGRDQRIEKGEPAGDLIFHGKLTTLANAHARSDDSESRAVAWLVENNWLLDLNDKQRRWRGGKWTSFEYLVLEHDERSARYSD